MIREKDMKKIEIVKWLATGTLIVSVGFNGLGMHPIGPIVQIIGGLLWSTAAFTMKDKPLIITNVVMTAIGIITLTYSLL